MLELLRPRRVHGGRWPPPCRTARTPSTWDYGDFNARRNAKNFSEEEFAAAVSYCHIRGAKVYLTLNTLLTDRELPRAAEAAARASAIGADAVLVQDLGVVRMLRQTAPDLPVHASTQMTLHSLDGVKMAADLGMSRAVLSRELPRDQIAYICRNAPIEIEVFAHGALCMCYSGQCFLSSVIGGRSGNRGLCAQPCRLKYGWGDKADGYPLSLKDLSLAGHLRELDEMGVTCVKIEGRMKRPEYVAVVTGIYSRAIRERREPTAEELEQLRSAFSRQGFTQGYYLDEQGPDMFGTRQEEKEPRELFAAARNTYQSGEAQRVPVTFYAMLRPGEPARVGVEDPQGRVATVEGPAPEAARTRPLTAETVEKQLSRTGGTPLPLRKGAGHGGGRAFPPPGRPQRPAAAGPGGSDGPAGRPARPPGRGVPPRRPVSKTERSHPLLTISVRRAEQVTKELLDLGPALVYLPLEELCAHPELAQAPAGTKIGVILPRVAWDREYPALTDALDQARRLGITDALVGNLGLAPIARAMGFALRGDFGLEVYNSQAVKEYKRLGFASLTLSFEMKLAQVRDISKHLDTELITYGRLPLMIMENCIIKNRTGACSCQNVNILTDRKGARFPVLPAPGCRSELFNSQKLFPGGQGRRLPARRPVGPAADVHHREPPGVRPGRPALPGAEHLGPHRIHPGPLLPGRGVICAYGTENQGPLPPKSARPSPSPPGPRRAPPGSTWRPAWTDLSPSPPGLWCAYPPASPSPCRRPTMWPWCSPARGWAYATGSPCPTGWGSSTATTGGRSRWGSPTCPTRPIPSCPGTASPSWWWRRWPGRSWSGRTAWTAPAAGTAGSDPRGDKAARGRIGRREASPRPTGVRVIYNTRRVRRERKILWTSFWPPSRPGGGSFWSGWACPSAPSSPISTSTWTGPCPRRSWWPPSPREGPGRRRPGRGGVHRHRRRHGGGPGWGRCWASPPGEADAERMLTALAGRTHFVYTGLTVLRGRPSAR